MWAGQASSTRGVVSHLYVRAKCHIVIKHNNPLYVQRNAKRHNPRRCRCGPERALIGIR